MKTKKIADKPAVVSDSAAASAAAPKMARASRASAHKHKKALTATPETAPVEAVESPAGPTHEEIAVRAYLIAEARGFQGGSPAEDWFQAEQQLREELLGRA